MRISKPLTIGIAGAGPAGLAAALLLHRDGHWVTLFERFGVPQPVGSGLMLQPTGMAVLTHLGLAQAVAQRGARIERLYGLEASGRVSLDAPYAALAKPGVVGIGIHRASLFEALYDSVATQDVPIETGRAVAGVAGQDAKRRFVFEDGSASADFDLVIDACGWNSPLDPAPKGTLPYGALWASLPVSAQDPYARGMLEQRYRKARQMAGVLPIGARSSGAPQEVAFFWSLRAQDYPRWQDTPLDTWKAEVLSLWPELDWLLARIEDREQLTFARYSHRTAAPSSDNRIARIGDAWHSASPQLGQGANMALLDAYALALGLREARTAPEGLRLARSWRRGHVALYQLITAIFTPLYQSDAQLPAAARDRIVAPLSRLRPIGRLQAQLMSGLFGAPLAALGLELPDYSSITASIAARASAPAQSKSPATRQTSMPLAS